MDEEKEFESFEYLDVDYVKSPNGWLEARLENRFREGFNIYRDHNRLSWRGVKNYKHDKPMNIFKQFIKGLI